MMDKKAVQSWARTLVAKNPNNLIDPDNYITHLGQVYDVAEGVVRNILEKYPNIPIIVGEVSVAAGLHDIGRPLQKDQIFHELRGANYTEQNGLEKGVAGSLKDTYRIAQMFRSHSFAYEHWQDQECVEKRKEFESLDVCLLIPRTWQEAIVTYSDLTSKNGERVEVKNNRFDETLQKYGADPRYQNLAVVKAIKAGINRVLELAVRVEALEQGKLTEQDISKYGFL